MQAQFERFALASARLITAEWHHLLALGMATLGLALLGPAPIAYLAAYLYWLLGALAGMSVAGGIRVAQHRHASGGRIAPPPPDALVGGPFGGWREGGVWFIACGQCHAPIEVPDLAQVNAARAYHAEFVCPRRIATN